MKNKYFLLFLIIVVASFFRLYNLSSTPPGLYPDEAMNGNNAIEANATGEYKVFYPENNGREGLFINIQAGFLKFMPNEPETLRLPSAIFGILTVLGLYLLTKEIFLDKRRGEKETIALLSSFFLAISFWHIMFSRIGFRAIMAPCFAVFALYFFLKAIRSSENRGKIKIYTLAGVGGIFFGLGFYSYIAYRVLPLLFILLIPFFYKNKMFWKTTFVFVFFITLIASPIGIYFLNNPQDFMGRTSQVSIFSDGTPVKILLENTVKTLGMFNFKGDGNWRHNYAGAPLLYWPVGILFLIGAVVSLFYVRKDKGEKISATILFGWFVLATLPVIISNEGLPHALRAILMIPPIFIFAGRGGEFVAKKIKEYAPILRKPFFTFSMIFFFLLILNSYQKYFVSWADNENTAGAFSQNYVDIGREINSLPQETSKYVIVESGGVLVKGIPMPAQTIMFLTDTFRLEKQKEKNMFYVLPKNKGVIPKGAYQVKI